MNEVMHYVNFALLLSLGYGLLIVFNYKKPKVIFWQL